MRAGRLVSILLTLQRRGRVTASELARELEVSERTILRDIDELSGAGVPVYGLRGPGGGFELLDTVDGLPPAIAPTTDRRSSGARRGRVRITPEGRRLAAVLGLLQPLRVSRAGGAVDGRLSASFRIRSHATAVVEVLALGSHVEVVGPADLRSDVAGHVELAAARYRERSEPSSGIVATAKG